ncbi:box C/D snoRNA protein 1 isoform X2 [Scomber scombrus]|uniref:Box C/D snoRNA protein 1 n=1 Tax=Scomber scombrus TaxID=13677 RepID=A0AAV1PHJ3_SCOSC
MCSAISPTTGVMSNAKSQDDNSCQEEESRAKKRKISLANCSVCGSEEAKYRCPACLTHSCSLLCVKKHKGDSGCSGVRNKTAFVTLSLFDEMTLLNDYRFLEDTGRFADGANRDNLIRTPRSTLKTKKLASNARKMNITLRFLPITFTKSKENSTFFFTKYHNLDIQKSLRDNLSYKTLIEYPVLHVVLKDYWKDYPLKGPGSRIPGGTDIWTGTSETSPETKPPQEKKAKKEAGKEELEEGELTDSSDEDEEEGNTVQNNPCNKGCDGAKSSADDMDFTEDELADSVDKVVDDSNNKHSDSSRDQCINKDITGSTDENRAVSESAEISVTKEDALKESGSVSTHHCSDENESANTTDSCGLE